MASLNVGLVSPGALHLGKNVLVKVLYMPFLHTLEALHANHCPLDE